MNNLSCQYDPIVSLQFMKQYQSIMMILWRQYYAAMRLQARYHFLLYPSVLAFGFSASS